MILPTPYEVEHTDFPSVLAFDPGGITGWCVMSVHVDALLSDEYAILDNITHWEQGQLDVDEHQQEMEIAQLMEAWDSAALLFEGFELRTVAAELSPVRLTAVAAHIARHYFMPPRPIFKQMPSHAMTTITDRRLKDWGLYKPGQEHARDAERHAILFLRRAKANPKLRKLAWPKIYGDLSVSEADARW